MSLSYDRIAERYDELYGEEQRAKYRVTLRYVFTKGATLLDAGCGTGLLLEHVRDVEYYVGIDVSRNMLRKAVKRAKAVRVLCDFVMGSVELMPFRNLCFNILLAFTVVHEAPLLVREAKRVVKQGGLISITLLKKSEKLKNVLKKGIFSGARNKVIINDQKIRDIIYIAMR